MEERARQVDISRVTELKGWKRKLPVVVIAALGFLSFATAGEIRDDVWATEDQIRLAHPNGPQQLWERLEGEQNLPQKRTESNALFAATAISALAGILYVLHGSSPANSQDNGAFPK